MTPQTFAWRVGGKLRRMAGIDRPQRDTHMSWIGLDDVAAHPDMQSGDLARIFRGNEGRIVDKWMHYFPVYERYLSPFRGTPFRMLEIGVFQGGSLEMWRRWFGPDATLYGIDIDPACARFVDPPNQVRIGSQADAAFLKGVVVEMGGLDVVLDDGSHVAEHQEASFRALFPLLRDGGLYMIEDLHTAYWPKEFNGGYRRAGTGIELLKDAVDDMHHWYHGRKFRTVAEGDIAAVHVHDSIAVIEKRAARAPVRAEAGHYAKE